MIFVLNPGDFLDVRTFDDRERAMHAFTHLGGFPRLYKCFRQGDRPNGRFCWEEYTADFGWMTINRDNLPIKVLEAGER